MKSIITVLIEKESGALVRIISLMNRRRFNIESIAIGSCERKALKRLTITIINESNNKEKTEQLIKQLKKIINVLEVKDITSRKHIQRELCLIKIRVDSISKKEILQISKIFDFKIISLTESTITIEITEESSKIKELEKILQPYEILQNIRTGKIALTTENKLNSEVSREFSKYNINQKYLKNYQSLSKNMSKDFFMPPLVRYEFRLEEGRIQRNNTLRNYDEVLTKYRDKHQVRPRKFEIKRCAYLWRY